MAQITNRAQLATVLTTALDDVFDNRGKKLKKIYPRFLTVKNPEKGQWIDDQMAYFGKLAKKGEQDPISYDQIEWGTPFTTEFDEYALGFRITRAAADDMMSGGYGVQTERLLSYATITAKFQDSALATQEDLGAQLILLANSATATAKWQGAGRDGAALAGTHTLLKNGVGTFSNVMTGAALSYYQLQSAITLLETIPGDEGFYTPIPSKLKLVVGPYNRHRAYELCRTRGKKPDTFENTANALDEFDIEPVVDPYVGATFKGWALIDDDETRYKCRFYNRVAPELEKEGDFEVKGMKYSVYMRCKVGHSGPYGFVFNPGP